jgi:hypothetical protein
VASKSSLDFLVPSESTKAIFLSYASQDAEAARRIGDALREAGLEVWFDQSELRGGDAWDEMIGRQIAECALFIPIISTATAARLEGYFRLEWTLADQRTQRMARTKPLSYQCASMRRRSPARMCPNRSCACSGRAWPHRHGLFKRLDRLREDSAKSAQARICKTGSR